MRPSSNIVKAAAAILVVSSSLAAGTPANEGGNDARMDKMIKKSTFNETAELVAREESYSGSHCLPTQCYKDGKCGGCGGGCVVA